MLKLMLTDECPSISLTTLTLTPLASKSVAAVCRRSWKRIDRAFLTAILAATPMNEPEYWWTMTSITRTGTLKFRIPVRLTRGQFGGDGGESNSSNDIHPCSPSCVSDEFSYVSAAAQFAN